MAQFVNLNPGSLRELHVGNERLVSYNVEMTEVTGGTFWKAYTPAQIAGTEPFVLKGGFLGNALAEIDPTLFLARAEGFPVGSKEHILGDIKDFLQVFALRLPVHVVLRAEERRIGVFRSFRHQFSPPSLRMRLISSDSTNACTRVRSCPELPLLYRRSTERTGQFFSSAIMWLTSARSKPQ